MIPNWNKILKEWSYRVGIIKPNNTKHLEDLKDILIEKAWPIKTMPWKSATLNDKN